MDRASLSHERREAAKETTGKVEAAGTSKWSASREEAAELRRRLLKLIVENELKRRQSPLGQAPSITQV